MPAIIGDSQSRSGGFSAARALQSPRMDAAIIAIGDELALGQTVDTNTAYLAARLAEQGLMAALHLTVPDDQAAIADALRTACAKTNLVLVTGGLGPTDDDLTRQALADVMGQPLVEDPHSLAAIESFFAHRGRPMAQRNRIQAMHPRGSSMIPNTCGTAPGIVAQVAGARVFVMPGVPNEMRAMWQQAVRPALAALAGNGRVIRTALVHTFGLGESDLAQRLDELMARDRNPMVGTTVSGGVVSVRVRSTFPTADEAQRRLDAAVAAVEQRLGPIVFGRDEQTLEQVVVRLLGEHGLTLAAAESCTGGLAAKLITDVPGASSVFRGGWVTYDNAMKTAWLGVPDALIAAHGAVSVEVAAAMATGAMRQAEADVALSVTGIAGPEGGTAEKPVGTVCVAVARRTRDDRGQARIQAGTLRLLGDRPTVRHRAAYCLLQLLRLHLTDQPLTALSWYRPTPEISLSYKAPA